jgi:RimJ/RimL family protein N-acetyltransferase
VGDRAGREGLTTVRTERLLLRPFTAADRASFAALNTHPRVVEWLGAPRTRSESDALVDDINAEIEREGWGLWAVEVQGGAPFIGMVGLHRVPERFPFTPAVEIGWRLDPAHWGHGYATEAATASLGHGFAGGLAEIVAYTAAGNVRSQAVMRRIGMARDPAADFDHPTLPADSPLRAHVLYRIRSQPEPDVTAGA